MTKKGADHLKRGHKYIFSHVLDVGMYLLAEYFTENKEVFQAAAVLQKFFQGQTGIRHVDSRGLRLG